MLQSDASFGRRTVRRCRLARGRRVLDFVQPGCTFRRVSGPDALLSITSQRIPCPAEQLRASIREQVGDAELGVKYARRLAQEYLEAHDAARDESSKIQAKADCR